MYQNEIINLAKQRVQCEESSDEYPVHLYCAIRGIFEEIDFKEAAKAVIHECKEFGIKIDWKSIFTLDTSVWNLIPEETIRDFESCVGEPKGNLANLIWLDSYITSFGNTIEHFLLRMDQLKSEYREEPDREDLIVL